MKIAQLPYLLYNRSKKIRHPYGFSRPYAVW